MFKLPSKGRSKTRNY